MRRLMRLSGGRGRGRWWGIGIGLLISCMGCVMCEKKRGGKVKEGGRVNEGERIKQGGISDFCFVFILHYYLLKTN